MSQPSAGDFIESRRYSRFARLLFSCRLRFFRKEQMKNGVGRGKVQMSFRILSDWLPT